MFRLNVRLLKRGLARTSHMKISAHLRMAIGQQEVYTQRNVNIDLFYVSIIVMHMWNSTGIATQTFSVHFCWVLFAILIWIKSSIHPIIVKQWCLTCSTIVKVPGAIVTTEATALWFSELSSMICWRMFTWPTNTNNTSNTLVHCNTTLDNSKTMRTRYKSS